MSSSGPVVPKVSPRSTALARIVLSNDSISSKNSVDGPVYPSTFNSIVRWTENLNQVKDSKVIVSDDGSITTPGSLTLSGNEIVDGTLLVKQESRLNGLILLSGLKSLKFDLSGIADNTTSTLIIP